MGIARDATARQLVGLSEVRTYTVAQAARLLGIGRNQAYEAAHRGELPVIRIGKRLLISKRALDRLLENGSSSDA